MGFQEEYLIEINNHFDQMDNLTFFRRFRLTKPTVLHVLEQIEEQLEYPDDRNNSISPVNQLLTCLRCYATGGHLSLCADFTGIAVSIQGSTHDQTIFINSRIRARFEANEFPNFTLLGDSGYALNYLLTLIADPQTDPQQLYNEAHIRTRNSIERLIGVWKRRFPILTYGCRLKLETTLTVIPATAVLHNIAIQINEDEPPAEGNMGNLNYLIEMGNIPNVPHNDGEQAQVPQGQVFRNNVINYFANL